MHEAYKMVIVNSIGSLILLSSIFFYKYIYPKKKINLFILLILISILPVISILRPGAYESGDFNIHIYRSMEFYKSLSEGNIIPSWAMDLNATYGYPLFSFNYTLPYYLISFFHFLGFSFIASLKVFLILNLFFSGILMYLFSKYLFKDKLAAFTASIFYIFTPYHLISLHFKITIGEILSFTLIPLLFLFIQKLITEKKYIYIILSGLLLGLISLSHIYIAIILFPVICLYIFNKLNINISSVIYIISIFLINLAISFFQVLPPLIYKNSLFTNVNPVNINALYYPSIIDLLYSPWRYGLLFQGPKGELSFLIGYAQLAIVILLMISVLRNKIIKKYKKEIVIWLLLFFVFVLLVNPISKELWNKIPILSSAGSHRFLILIAFCISVLSGYYALINKKRKIFIYLIVIIAIGTTILNWGQRRVIPEINDGVLKSNLPLSTAKGEAHFYANSKWANPKKPWFSIIPQNHLEILRGEGIIKNTYRSSTKHVYEISAKSNILLKENTLYFPGWMASSNGKNVNLEPDKNGIINLRLSKGNHTLELSYKDLPLFTISKIVSLISILFIFIYSLCSLRHLLQKA